MKPKALDALWPDAPSVDITLDKVEYKAETLAVKRLVAEGQPFLTKGDFIAIFVDDAPKRTVVIDSTVVVLQWRESVSHRPHPDCMAPHSEPTWALSYNATVTAFPNVLPVHRNSVAAIAKDGRRSVFLCHLPETPL